MRQKADKGMTIRLVILNDTSCKCLKKVHLKFKLRQSKHIMVYVG